MILKKKIVAGLISIPLAFNLHAAQSNPMLDLGIQLGSSLGSVLQSGVSSLFSNSDEQKTEPNKEETKPAEGISGFFGSLFKAPTPEETLAKASDKAMTKAFLDVQKSDPKLSFSLNNNAIVFDRVIVPFDSAATFGQARSLCANIDTSNDKIAEEFKKVAIARGNYYTIYNGTVNASLQNAIYGQLSPSNGNDEYYKYDFDNAIIEYAPDGTIVSALTRMDKISLNMMIRPKDINYYNIEIRQISRIFAKTQLSVVSRTVSKRLFDDNLVLTSKQDIKPLPATISQPVVQQDSTAKLKELFELYKAGALTKEEFDKAKQKLLGS